MKVTALCIHMLMNTFLLLAAQDEHTYSARKADEVLLHIEPERLQFYLYEAINIYCKGTENISGWKVMKELHKMSPSDSRKVCNTAAPTCRISPALVSYSGKYWCENEAGEKSDSLNISVADGSVILVIPTRPVIEGSDVILHCLERGNENKSGRIVDYYRNRKHFDTGYYTNNTIKNVSKSDEGLYKCSISGSGESPESWLAVLEPDQVKAPLEETSSHGNTQIILILKCTIPLVTLVLVVVMGGLLHMKLKDWKKNTENDLNQATYTVVRKQRKCNGGENNDGPDCATYANFSIKKKKVYHKPCPEEDPVYSSINTLHA